MEQNEDKEQNGSGPDLRSVVQSVIEEFVEAQRQKADPAYKAELLEERKRREQLESRVNELVHENAKTRHAAEEAERNSAIRAELQRLGVSKVDLAFRAVKDDIVRDEDGHLVARGGSGDQGLKDYLTQFVHENPELLPARISGGAGMSSGQRSGPAQSALDLDKIRPGMNPEDLERVRQEVSRLASQTLKGL